MDRFDKIWKERLKEPETPALDWCSPSDQVWTAVSKEVFPPKDRRVFAWWWVGLGLVLISAIMFIYFMAAGSVLTTDAQSSVKANKQEIATSSTSSLDKNNHSQENASKETIVESRELGIKEDKKLLTVKEDENSMDETSTDSPSNKFATQVTAQNHSQKKIASSDKDNAEISLLKSETMADIAANTNAALTIEHGKSLAKAANSEVIGNDEDFTEMLLGAVQASTKTDDRDSDSKTEAISIEVSEAFAKKVLETSDDEPSLLNKLDGGILKSERKVELKPFVEKPIELLANSSYSLRVSSGVFEWKHNLSEAFTNDLSDFDFNYVDSYGVFIRLDMQKSVSPLFAFGIGVELDRVEIESGHNSPLDYLLDDEVGGLKENDYKLDLATPYGLMPASFKFFRDDALASDANLLVDFSNEHLIYNLRAPITFTLTPFRGLKKWQFGLDAGLGFNYIAQLSNRAQGIVTNHSQIHLQDSSVKLSDQDIKRFHLDVFGAAFVERRFNDRWALRTYYEHNWGQSKLFELGAYHTKIDRRYFGIGLSKKIK